MNKWELGPRGNYILDAGSFMISYRDNCGDASIFQQDAVTAIQAIFFGHAMIGDVDEETALHLRGSDKYFVLNGDWRTDYEKLIEQGYEACLAFFKEKRSEGHASSLTDEPEE